MFVSVCVCAVEQAFAFIIIMVVIIVIIFDRLKETELKLMESEKRLNDAYQDMNNMRFVYVVIITV